VLDALEPDVPRDLPVAGDGEDPDSRSLLEPPGGPVSGYYQIRLRVSQVGMDARRVTGVRVGGIRAYDLQVPGDGELVVTVQGHPDGGEVDVALDIDGGTTILPQPFRYDAPPHPALARVVGFGASLSQGIQQTVPSLHGALSGPIALVARQTGAYMPLPLPLPDLFPRLDASDVGPPPDCILPDAVQSLLLAVGDVIERLQEPVTKTYSYRPGRIDPDLVPGNLAAGNCSVDELLHGVKADNLPGAFLGHLVYEPDADLLDPLEGCQIDLVEAALPTLVLSTDFYGNDVLWGVALGRIIDPSLARPEPEVLAGIAEVVRRLAATEAEVFLANLPPVSLLPATAQKARASTDSGLTDTEVQQRIAGLDHLADRANEALETAASVYENVHVVDLHGWSMAIARDGLVVGDQILTIGKFGGLVGLDGIHFTDTGYAVMANVFLDAINQVLGTGFPYVDLEAVLRTDPESPESLRNAGLDSCINEAQRP
jgi:lysophospholipase L1-like esterase